MNGEQTIHTDASGLVTGSDQLPVCGGALPIYHARPAALKNLPSVLVVQEIFGANEHIRDICRRLAKLGYLAIAPELYFRHGDPASYDSVPRLLAELVSRVADAEVLGDLDACAAWAAAHGGDPARLGITGFCWGGRITWLYAAHNPAVKAAVAWYGRLHGVASEQTPRHPLDLVPQLDAPVLGLYAGQDQSIPVADAEAMRSALQAAGKRCDLVIYPEAGHAFHADYRPSYCKAAAEDGWRRLLSWFALHGV